MRKRKLPYRADNLNQVMLYRKGSNTVYGNDCGFFVSVLRLSSDSGSSMSAFNKIGAWSKGWRGQTTSPKHKCYQYQGKTSNTTLCVYNSNDKNFQVPITLLITLPPSSPPPPPPPWYTQMSMSREITCSTKWINFKQFTLKEKEVKRRSSMPKRFIDRFTWHKSQTILPNQKPTVSEVGDVFKHQTLS